MSGGLGQTSLEVSISTLGAAAGCAVASAFFFFFLSLPYTETGEASPRASRMTNTASALPLRFDLGGNANISLLSCCLPHVNPVLVAGVAECHVVLLVFHQQTGLRRSVRLMAAQASHVSLDLGYIRRIHHVGDGVTCHRMAQPEPQRQNRHLVLLIVVLRQVLLAVEDGQHMLSFQLLRLGVEAVALQAECIPLGPQQMIVVAAMGLVASGAALPECGLVVHGFLAEIGNVAAAAQANVHRICLGEPRLPAGMGAMAVGAIGRASRMLHLGALDGFSFVVVAGHAKRLGIGDRK